MGCTDRASIETRRYCTNLWWLPSHSEPNSTSEPLHRNQYPIPRVDDLFSPLAGGKAFSKLDLSHAYQQLLLDEETKMYVTINTHRGLFKYNRLPFGVSFAQAIFQRVMDSILQERRGAKQHCTLSPSLQRLGRTNRADIQRGLEKMEEDNDGGRLEARLVR